jgi:hypothetical protein
VSRILIFAIIDRRIGAETGKIETEIGTANRRVSPFYIIILDKNRLNPRIPPPAERRPMPIRFRTVERRGERIVSIVFQSY